MFYGEITHSLDNKGRLTLPARHREALEAGLVITRHPVDRCLQIYPQQVWDQITSKVNNLPVADARTAMLRRLLFSAAEDMAPDKQGRILISQRLREHAQIATDVVIAGAGTFLELWHPPLWDENVLRQFDNSEINRELFAALNV
jgi:MraZ protein